MKNIYLYFLFTFLISWALWSPFYFSTEVSEFWALPGAWGPTIAAILITWIHDGKKGVKHLLRKILIWRVSVRNYLFATGLPSALVMAAMLLAKLFFDIDLNLSSIPRGMGLDDGDILLSLVLAPLFFLITAMVGGPIAEELGWRGFAQEKLQLRYSASISGLIVGFFWVIWHLPLMIFLPQGIGHMPILAYVLVMVNMSILFAWLYNQTKGSVLLAILFHAGMNFENMILGSENLQNTATLTIYILLLTSINFILQYRFYRSDTISQQV